MGFWGWRPLLITVFISVWVTGCNLVTENTPNAVPTPYPQITLTIGRPPPGKTSTPTRAATQPPTSSPRGGERPTLAGVRSSPTPTPLALDVHPPTCYLVRAGSIVCLGRIENPLSMPVERVVLSVDLLTEEQGVLQTELAAVEQSIIPAGGSAPYRALFTVTPSQLGSTPVAAPNLLSSDAAQNVEARFVPLELVDERSALVEGRFIVTATLINRGTVHVDAVRVVVTLYDKTERVSGYRVLTMGGLLLAPGASLPLRIEVAPQAGANAAHYTLYVEARRPE